MKARLVLVTLALASLSSAESVPVDPKAWQGMNESVQAYQDRDRPAPVDAKSVDALWRRLAKNGTPIVTPEGETALAYERSVEPDASGVAENRLVYLVEMPMETGGLESTRPVFRRSYSHLVASSEGWSRAPDGARRVEIWRYIVSLDGVLRSVVRHEITLKDAAAGAKGQAEADESRSRAILMRPSDPVVQRRWRELSAELLTMGPVIRI